MIGAPSAAISQSVETWKLVKKEYPVLPAVILEITEGRNAGSFVKMRRTQMINEVVYTTKSVERGTTLCTWISAFIWDDNFPEIINSGKEYNIDVEARLDRREGESWVAAAWRRCISPGASWPECAIPNHGDTVVPHIVANGHFAMFTTAI